METSSVRADIDDRSMTLQKRVREAEIEWVPYIIVVGQKELDSGVLPVRDRATGEMRRLNLDELIAEVKKTIANKPYRPLPLPKYLSKRPQFYG
jgi:threonyl-tRNA synthetase